MKKLEQISDKLRQRALQYPETYEEAPWGERVVKVNNKIFLFAGLVEDKLHATVHLPISGFQVLAAPFAAPAGYNLGKSGWVSLTFESAGDVPLPDVFSWIDESYRTVAPKRLLKDLPLQGPPDPVIDDEPLPEAWARVALAGDDALRAERAAQGLRRLGVETVLCGEPRPELVENLVSTPPPLLIIDLGRRAAVGIELGRAAEEACPGLRILFAGVRDAKMEQQAANQVPEAELARQAPGDPALLKRIAELLA